MYPLLIGDERRGRVILVNHEGASYYQIPNDHGAKGTWQDLPDSAGVTRRRRKPRPVVGCEGVHRADFNQTFFAST